jgi:MinD-like ATPase involved in chromosome partitioning or flagellar assembly
VAGFIPSDYQTAVTSINLGQPLVQSEPSSKIAVEIKRITAGITGQAPHAEEQPQRRRLFGGLFKRGGNAAAAQPNLDLGATLGKV